MQPTTIALIRHGETEWNAQFRIQGHTDVPLNARGEAQSTLVAESLRHTEWHRVFTSPLSRAAVTAQIIAAELELEHPEHREDLIERFFGAAEGLPGGPALDAVRLADGEFLDAETEHAVGTRGSAALELIHETYTGQNLIVVSHGSYIRCTLNVMFEMQAPRIRNTGVTLLERHADGWRVLMLNDEQL